MSQLTMTAHRRALRDADQQGIPASWIVPCILALVSGCYFGPIELIDANQAPVLKDSNYADGETIVLERQDQFIFVVVQDEEPELLNFTWALSADGFITDARSFPDGRSQALLSNDLELDGQRLSLQVSDGSHELDLEWPLEVVP